MKSPEIEIINKLPKDKVYKTPKLKNMFVNNEKKIIDKLSYKIKQKINNDGL